VILKRCFCGANKAKTFIYHKEDFLMYSDKLSIVSLEK
jgi:hypothetical protein